MSEPRTEASERVSQATLSLRVRLLDAIPTALLWRYLCHSLMLGLAMINETRGAPHLPDTLLSLVPYQGWVHRYNYHIWLLAYLPVALLLWRASRAQFVHFLYVGGILSLVRGLCIGLTGLGPVTGGDINAGMSAAAATSAWWDLVNPIGSLMGQAPHVWLTKDLFFSGHTATTFLLVLYCWPHARLRWLALAAHAFVVAVVFASHLHYTIDVVGAWAITYCLFAAAGRLLPRHHFRERQ